MATRGTDPARGILGDPAGDAAFAQNAQGQYGVHPNAEALIEAHRATMDPALQKASLLAPDAEQTFEAKSDMKAAAKKLGVKDGEGEIVDVSVRGNALIGVVEYPDGTVGKVVGGWTDDYTPPRLTPEQAEASARAQADAEQSRAIQRLEVEFQSKLQDTIVEMREEMTSEIDKIRQQAEKEQARAVEAAQKDSESDTSSRSSSRRGRSSSSRSKSRSTKTRSSSGATGSGSGAQDGSSLSDGVRSPEEKKGESSGE